jgi:hypothetical protein
MRAWPSLLHLKRAPSKCLEESNPGISFDGAEEKLFPAGLMAGNLAQTSWNFSGGHPTPSYHASLCILFSSSFHANFPCTWIFYGTFKLQLFLYREYTIFCINNIDHHQHFNQRHIYILGITTIASYNNQHIIFFLWKKFKILVYIYINTLSYRKI